MFIQRHGWTPMSFLVAVLVASSVVANTTSTTTTTTLRRQPWALIKGECGIDAEGCITSPNYPRQYGQDQKCLFLITNDKYYMDVKDFQTEHGKDWLTVNDLWFSGDLGNSPHGVKPKLAGFIGWLPADTTVGRRGWEICPTHGPPRDAPSTESSSGFNLAELFDELFDISSFQEFLGLYILMILCTSLQAISNIRSHGHFLRGRRQCCALLLFFWYKGMQLWCIWSLCTVSHHAPVLVITLWGSMSSGLRIFCRVRVMRLSDETSEARIQRLVPVSVYTDLNGNILECLAMFSVQLMLFCFVALTVLGQDKLDMDLWMNTGKPFVDEQLFFYVCGALVSVVLQIRGHSFIHNELLPFWEPYFEEFADSDHWPRFRLFCSLLVNHVFSEVVLTLLPVILMNSENLMEFVKDATCVAFISEMDNLHNVDNN